MARWVLALGLRHPAVAVPTALLVGWIPLLARLSPLGDIAIDPAWELLGAWIAPVGLVGTGLALFALGRGEAFLELLPWGSRLGAEALGLFAGCLGPQLFLGLGALLIAGSGPGLAPVSWLLGDLQGVGLALLLLRWKLHSGVRLSLFGGLLWVLPAMLPAAGRSATLRVLVDVGGAGAGASAGEAWIATGALVLGLALANLLLASPRTRSAPADNRHPR